MVLLSYTKKRQRYTMHKTVYLEDVVAFWDLADAINAGYVRVQSHPTEPLRIYNYTAAAVFERAWNRTTMACRGLIVNEKNQVVARPFPKFFNYGEPETGPLPMDERVVVFDKLDGSLGILYPTSDGYAIATRGSFVSDQAQHATRLLRERYADFAPRPGLTYLFEIIYPENRVVCDYGDYDDLVLLGTVDIETGKIGHPYAVPEWVGPKARQMPARTLAEALKLPPRKGAEGLVVRYVDSGQMVRVKQADYLALHAVITNTSARTIWEFCAVNACKHLITHRKMFGSLLGIDPRRGEEILKIGENWLSHLLANVPDEFYGWLNQTIYDLYEKVDELGKELLSVAANFQRRYGDDRKELAESLRIIRHPHEGAIFQLISGADITPYVWRAVYPEPTRAWGCRSDDVA